MKVTHIRGWLDVQNNMHPGHGTPLCSASKSSLRCPTLHWSALSLVDAVSERHPVVLNSPQD